MGSFKYTNEYIDEKLLGRSIQRLTDSMGALGKCQWKCLVEDCEYTWITTPSKVIDRNQGCRKCSGLLKITVDQFDQYLNSKNIKRLSEFDSLNKDCNYQCLVEGCNYIWTVKAATIYNNSGCPKCAGVMPLSNEILDQRLIGRNIKRIGNFVNSKTKIEFQCLVADCNYIWLAKFDNIFSGGKGCPKCSNSLPLNNNIIDSRLLEQGRTIKRIGNYVSIHSKIEWMCNKGHTWLAEPNEVINAMHGCRVCIYKNQNIVYDTLKSLNIDFDFQKDIRTLNFEEKRKCMLDFYIPKLYLAIEYDGEQHYRPVNFGGMTIEDAEAAFIKQQERDQYVENFCKNNNLTILRINGSIYKNKKLNLYVKEIISQHLNKIFEHI